MTVKLKSNHLRTIVTMIVALLWFACMPSAWAQAGSITRVEHARTGFPLTGAHATQRCESCHVGGIFKGTPKDCRSCHATGSRFSRGNTLLTPNHIPVNASRGCDSCHGMQGFSGAKYNHGQAQPGSCQTCHDGIRTTGKPGAHIVTRSSCDTCHSTSSWASARPDHSAFSAATTCSSCHNGTTASGKTTGHIPTSLNCLSCHGTNRWKPSSWNHTQSAVTRQCASCHSGAHPPASGKPGAHISTTAQCDTCHRSLVSWTGAKVDHAGFGTNTNCASCHNGSTATGKPGSHMPVGSTNCVSCHNTTGWKSTKWSHTQIAVVNQCASCHSGAFPPADGRPSNHIPYQSVAGLSSANCDSCHKGGFSSWTTGRFHANVTVTSQCSSCHLNSAYGQTAKPSTSVHANVTGGCESCHGTSGWANAKVDHSKFSAATQCSSCHNGSAATGKPGSHIPVGSTNCVSCHNTTGWTPTKWSHTQVAVTSQCASCHSGAFPPADGRLSNHIPYQSVAGLSAANCDSCHKGGFSSWTTGRFHANVTVTSQCSSCHLSSAYGQTAKPSTSVHTNVTGGCESCHGTSGWANAKVDHSKFSAATQCSSCHNGSAATGKPGSHIPVGSTNCVSCHNTTGWTPTKWSHTQVAVTSQCASCHSGAFPPADGRPSNHIPYQSVAGLSAANCDSCHKGGFSSWTTGRFHANVTVTSQCSSCHLSSAYGQTAKPSNTLHASVTSGCESCHNTSSWANAKVDHSKFSAATQCSSCHNGSAATGKPGSHIPVGSTNCVSCHNTTGWTPTKWSHTQVAVASQCASCHSGAFPPADGRPSNHIPYQSVAGLSAANCDSCHKGGFSSWTTGRFHANVTVTSQCSSCHLSSAYGQTAKPSNTLHASVTSGCESCHNTSSWANAKVDHSKFSAATQCSSCHNGSAATGKPGSHIPVGGTNCVSCHNTTGWTPTKWNHTQVAVTSQCASCHSGAFPPADGRPSNHIPYQSVAGLSAANCDSCHKGGFSSWTTGRFHANVTVTSQCSSCHLSSAYGQTARPNTALHAGVGSGCESCHRSTTSWLTVTYAHAPTNAVGTGTCDNCHNGSTAKGKPSNHIPIQVSSAKCDSCHRSQSSFASGVTMNHTAVSTMTCKTCHNGGYVGMGALAKPANHIPEIQLLGGTQMDCKACHTSTNVGGFGTAVMNHNNSQGNGSGWCYACHNTGTSYLGGMEKKSLTHRKSSGVTDCSQSGCHRPLGSKGSTYRNWD